MGSILNRPTDQLQQRPPDLGSSSRTAQREHATSLGLTILGEAHPRDLAQIDALRHEVYAVELGQYPCSPEATLADSHPHSKILCAKTGDRVVGFIAMTPPGSPRLRVEHYVPRESLPVAIGSKTAEARQLTVARDARAGTLAVRLLFGCLEWLDSVGAEDLLTMGHEPVIPMYEKFGSRRLGYRLRAGSAPAGSPPDA